MVQIILMKINSKLLTLASIIHIFALLVLNPLTARQTMSESETTSEWKWKVI